MARAVRSQTNSMRLRYSRKHCCRRRGAEPVGPHAERSKGRPARHSVPASRNKNRLAAYAGQRSSSSVNELRFETGAKGHAAAPKRSGAGRRDGRPPTARPYQHPLTPLPAALPSTSSPSLPRRRTRNATAAAQAGGGGTPGVRQDVAGDALRDRAPRGAEVRSSLDAAGHGPVPLPPCIASPSLRHHRRRASSSPPPRHHRCPTHPPTHHHRYEPTIENTFKTSMQVLGAEYAVDIVDTAGMDE